MKWRRLVLLWAAAACGESVIVASEVVGGAEPPGECTSESAAAVPAPAVLELIIDTSGTMDQRAPNERSSKWELTRDALLAAIEAMPEQTSLGVVFFPDVPDQSPICFNREADVPVGVLGALGSEHRQRIQDAFQAQTPEGGAPTHDAYQLAFDQLSMSRAPGQRFMLLITDDYPTYEFGCRSDGNPIDVNPLIAATGFAQSGGVSTFVVGLPGSDLERQARQALSRMAFAGGTAADGCSPLGPRYCHFDMTDEEEFPEGIQRALSSITATALRCSYTVPAASSAAADPTELEVSFRPEDGPSEILELKSAGPCDEGWQYSEDGARVVLCKGTCDQVREDTGRIELRTGCTAAAP